MFHSHRVTTLLVAAAITAGLAGCGTESRTQAMSSQELVKRGKYLTTVGGCQDCHTPKTMTPQGPVPNEAYAYAGHLEAAGLPPIDLADVPVGPYVLMNGDLTAFVGPWGISYAANLTPDNDTGIGTWTEEMFTKAMRTGKHMGLGRPILPPMPWPNVAQATDEDLRSIFAYLKSLKPIPNEVPSPVPPDQMADALAPM